MSSCLNPPNLQSMGEAVISAYRTRTSQDCCTIEIDKNTISHAIRQRHSSTEPQYHKPTDGSAFESPTSRIGYDEPMASSSFASPIRERLPCTSIAPRRKRRSLKLSSMSREQKRERRRVNQERRRNEQIQYVKDLTNDLRRLRGEVQRLEVRRLYTSLGVPTKQSVWNIATEYFRLFQRGVSPGAHYDVTLTFLQKTMSPNVSDGIMCGPEALLEKWRLLSLYFDGVNVHLNRLVEAGAHSVIAITAISITISPDTAQWVFPHLNSGEKKSEQGMTSLAAKLIGQTLEVHGSVCFDWDSKTERVIGVYSQSDLQTPLLRLLGSLEDVARVLEGALVTVDLRPRA